MTEFAFNKKWAIIEDVRESKSKDRKRKYHLVWDWSLSKVGWFFMGHPVFIVVPNEFLTVIQVPPW